MINETFVHQTQEQTEDHLKTESGIIMMYTALYNRLPKEVSESLDKEFTYTDFLKAFVYTYGKSQWNSSNIIRYRYRLDISDNDVDDHITFFEYEQTSNVLTYGHQRRLNTDILSYESDLAVNFAKYIFNNIEKVKSNNTWKVGDRFGYTFTNENEGRTLPIKFDIKGVVINTNPLKILAIDVPNKYGQTQRMFRHYWHNRPDFKMDYKHACYQAEFFSKYIFNKEGLVSLISKEDLDNFNTLQQEYSEESAKKWRTIDSVLVSSKEHTEEGIPLSSVNQIWTEDFDEASQKHFVLSTKTWSKIPMSDDLEKNVFLVYNIDKMFELVGKSNLNESFVHQTEEATEKDVIDDAIDFEFSPSAFIEAVERYAQSKNIKKNLIPSRVKKWNVNFPNFYNTKYAFTYQKIEDKSYNTQIVFRIIRESKSWDQTFYKVAKKSTLKDIKLTLVIWDRDKSVRVIFEDGNNVGFSYWRNRQFYLKENSEDNFKYFSGDWYSMKDFELSMNTLKSIHKIIDAFYNIDETVYDDVKGLKRKLRDNLGSENARF